MPPPAPPPPPPPQRVHLVRYGLRACELVPFVGPFDMPLSPSGLATAAEHGEFLSQLRTARPLLFLASPFRRSLTTAHAAAAATSSPVLVEPGLTEWYSPSLVGASCYLPPPLGASEWHRDLPLLDRGYAPSCPSPPPFPESEPALLARCAAALQALCARFPHADLALVSHAPCLLAFALALSGASPEDARLRPWVLGGVSTYAREGGGWRREREQHVGHLSGADKGTGGWTLPCLERGGA
ncbi:hypothetical protein TeGR_g11993 [Tetraparma gracilis]|uniref:Histidine phosphatase superfamily n=1 Tax=Tetraparma gracilis TaxID=2962635 RepID=A0ABQ6MBS5_9STRA|nr:hypothetical protein TeGR_g11993 [Tetraparma gracilis]